MLRAEDNTPAYWKALLQRESAALGFSLCGIAEAGPAPHAELFLRWIAEKKHGSMDWLARRPDRRTDPRCVLPGAHSVIVLAHNYFAGNPPVQSARPGAFARYAWGYDYHDDILRKLRVLQDLLRPSGAASRAYVDTGPVLERDFATEAGVGWNGKSTVQIHPRLGTWFFLAVILTTLELPADTPLPDRCGSCTRCIDACPTRAITATRRLDARRCLSYWTIEHRGTIPLEFRRPLGNRVFGCDDCLTVCPWNRFAQASHESARQAREFVTHWNLADFLTLDEAAFRGLFHRSPVKRTKRSGFLRNVCIALGNSGTPEDLPALEAFAAQEPEWLAEHARWAVGEIEERHALHRSGG
ncbi:MAG TPA: tRNA epoxyqueuosine(34) reductase QueG, partial [Verrucomicrobiales bacterium]|nr:tRNA epoxyqueuosine(34) reductase QueG [Verrucomicrobiales bacterium]